MLKVSSAPLDHKWLSPKSDLPLNLFNICNVRVLLQTPINNVEISPLVPYQNLYFCSAVKFPNVICIVNKMFKFIGMYVTYFAICHVSRLRSKITSSHIKVFLRRQRAFKKRYLLVNCLKIDYYGFYGDLSNKAEALTMAFTLIIDFQHLC